MKKTKRTVEIELPQFIYDCLDQLGFDYKKNFEQQCWDVMMEIIEEQINPTN